LLNNQLRYFCKPLRNRYNHFHPIPRLIPFL